MCQRINSYQDIDNSILSGVVIGSSFCGSLDPLPTKVTDITVLSGYADDIINKTTKLPPKLKKLTFVDRLTLNICPILHTNITHLQFCSTYSHSLRLATSITHLRFLSDYTQPYTELPPNLIYLTIYRYDHLTNLPLGISKLYFVYLINSTSTIDPKVYYYLLAHNNEYKEPDYSKLRVRINKNNRKARQSGLFDNL